MTFSMLAAMGRWVAAAWSHSVAFAVSWVRAVSEQVRDADAGCRIRVALFRGFHVEAEGFGMVGCDASPEVVDVSSSRGCQGMPALGGLPNPRERLGRLFHLLIHCGELKFRVGVAGAGCEAHQPEGLGGILVDRVTLK